MLGDSFLVTQVSSRPRSNKDTRATHTDQVGYLIGVLEVIQVKKVGVDAATETIPERWGRRISRMVGVVITAHDFHWLILPASINLRP